MRSHTYRGDARVSQINDQYFVTESYKQCYSGTLNTVLCELGLVSYCSFAREFSKGKLCSYFWVFSTLLYLQRDRIGNRSSKVIVNSTQ